MSGGRGRSGRRGGSGSPCRDDQAQGERRGGVHDRWDSHGAQSPPGRVPGASADRRTPPWFHPGDSSAPRQGRPRTAGPAELPTGATASAAYQTVSGADLPGTTTTPDGEKTDYTYDSAGNTKSVAVTGTGGGNQTFDYNPATPPCGGFEGQRCKATTEMSSTKSVSIAFTYDAKGNLTKVTPPAPLGVTTYTYDDLGRPSTVRDGRGVTVIYEYDERDRVVKVDSSHYLAVSYAYDGNGNLVQRSGNTGVVGYAFDPLNRETVRTLQDGSQTRLTYRAAGNVGTRTAEKWSDHSQFTSLTVDGTTCSGQYGSTDRSERIRLGDTFFRNGPPGLSAKTTGGVDMSFNREPGGTLNSMPTGGKSYYYLTDAIGSVVALADDTGAKVNTYSYSPRGVTRAATTEQVPQPYRFAGGYRDPTGLYHYEARYYDPNIGRFNSPDPSGQEKSPYLYAEDDPVNRIDPSGLLSFGDVTGMGDWAMTGCSVVAAGYAGATTAAYS
ncbi:hypothetical protein HW445_02925 [Streptomyces sp. UH6]|nr:hypothetical protein [Streptomyces sp. UH6]